MRAEYLVLTLIVGRFIAGFAFNIAYFIHFDRWLKRVYEVRHDEWIALGRPLGCFWVPRDSTLLNSSMARTSVMANLKRYGDLVTDAESRRCHARALKFGRYASISIVPFFLGFLLMILAIFLP